MDMLEFEAEDLYFDEPLGKEAQACIDRAAEDYAEGSSELPLLRAYFLEPDHPVVLVALYRFFYYQHRLEDALLVADKVISLFARRLELPQDWQTLKKSHIGGSVMISMTMLRFYMLALKGAGYLELRLGRYDSALQRLQKVADLDSSDRLGTRALMDVAVQALEEAGEPISVPVSG